MNIGDWVQRTKRTATGKVAGDREGQAHLIESVVAGDAFTNCGRRMDRETDAGVLVVIPHEMGELPADACSQCSPAPVEEGTEAPQISGTGTVTPPDEGAAT